MVVLLLNPTLQWRPLPLSTPSLFPSRSHPLSSSTTTQRQHKSKIPNSNFAFSSDSSLAHIKKIRFSARLQRPSNRRNSLREKLTQHQQNQVSSSPPNDYDNAKTTYSNSNENDVEESKSDSSYRVGEGISLGKLKSLEDSELRNKLESWANQYKADSECWGKGFNPVFTVFQNREGKVERVVVNEEEILERNGINPTAYRQSGFEVGFAEVNAKISHAKFLAREMESGNYEVPKSSSLAKVVALGNTGFVDSIQKFTVPSNFPMKKLSKIGIIGLFGFFVIWTIRDLFVGGQEKEEYTRLEKEMLRRKIKARKEKEQMVKGSVEAIDDPSKTRMATAERPRLDKEELLSSIANATSFGDRLVVQESSSYQAAISNDFDTKVIEIRAMARRAREIERGDSSSGDRDESGEVNFDDLSDKVEVVEKGGERVANGLSDSHLAQKRDFDKIIMPFFSNDLTDEHAISDKEPLANNNETQTSDLSPKVLDGGEKVTREVINPEESDKQDPFKDTNTGSTANSSGTIGVNYSFDTLNGQAEKAKRGIGKKPRVITSVKEAKDFLSQGKIIPEGGVNFTNQVEKETNVDTKQSEKQESMEEVRGKIIPKGGVNFTNQGDKGTNINTNQRLEKDNGVVDKTISGERNAGSEMNPSANNENWMENNFQTLEPVIKKIGGGFRENYAMAREKVKQESDITPATNFPEFDEDDGELDWMKDDKLREIVFQVRDNELLGRDPFHLMDEEEKLAFFEGLEEKVEKENEKLSKLHEYLHGNIENLDYGADGMSVYDPPEKIIPRWKGPPINQSQNQNPEFLENFVAQRKSLVNEYFSSPEIKSENGLNSLDKIKQSPSNEKILQKSCLNDNNKKSPKTFIEGSDGSFRAGKKSGKEFWAHTKKWSQGFLESYNAEPDPEIKAVMKDIGKDLDRWITPKEIQEAAELMDALPEKKKDFIEKKLNKVKREMELFGPQAVLSKYKEYGDQKEEDYLWWLDLPFVLCIELYTNDNGEQRIGLYSLEMAQDLELDPKPIHVIAFEDPGDCKNLCYIIQAHMEMLGKGNAFVIARPPKDAFQEAKANGFSVTVIRKGELQLNIDQTLEEVEEQITEIGTKIYDDKIMGERSVDINALMKGVFGAGKPSKRRSSRRKLKKPKKQ